MYRDDYVSYVAVIVPGGVPFSPHLALFFRKGTRSRFQWKQRVKAESEGDRNNIQLTGNFLSNVSTLGDHPNSVRLSGPVNYACSLMLGGETIRA